MVSRKTDAASIQDFNLILSAQADATSCSLPDRIFKY
jgi:hypothetical protein